MEVVKGATVGEKGVGETAPDCGSEGQGAMPTYLCLVKVVVAANLSMECDAFGGRRDAQLVAQQGSECPILAQHERLFTSGRVRAHQAAMGRLQQGIVINDPAVHLLCSKVLLSLQQ